MLAEVVMKLLPLGRHNAKSLKSMESEHLIIFPGGKNHQKAHTHRLKTNKIKPKSKQSRPGEQVTTKIM